MHHHQILPIIFAFINALQYAPPPDITHHIFIYKCTAICTTTRYYPSYLIRKFQNFVNDDYENNKQYYITNCPYRPSLQQGKWLRPCEREGLSYCEMCEGYCWELGGFLTRSKKKKRGEGQSIQDFSSENPEGKKSPKRRIRGLRETDRAVVE